MSTCLFFLLFPVHDIAHIVKFVRWISSNDLKFLGIIRSGAMNVCDLSETGLDDFQVLSLKTFTIVETNMIGRRKVYCSFHPDEFLV